jgi:phage antirepressor YoqD-like protein
MTALINETDLFEWTGYRHRDALVNWLRQNKIPYILGNKGRICVTADAVNLPLLRIQDTTQPADSDIF